MSEFQPSIANMKQLAQKAMDIKNAYGLHKVNLEGTGYSVNLFGAERSMGKVTRWHLTIICNNREVYDNDPAILFEEIDANLCPRCEENPIIEGDYLCEECR